MTGDTAVVVLEPMLTPIYIKKSVIYDGWGEAAAAQDDEWAYASLPTRDPREHVLL
jgi:hypothetical protein